MLQQAEHERPVILYIEDEPDLLEDVAEELEEAGYAVELAMNGDRALQLLSTIRPDLILCDITMPGMSGYEFLQQLRQTRPDLADIPFVFLTAQTDPQQVIDGKRAGADDYLIKPVDFDLMLATIQARITQVARIRQHHAAEVQGMQNALLELYSRRQRDSFGQITRAFDYVSFGIVLLTADQSVRFANRAARRMARAVAGMSLDGSFRLTGTRQSDALARAFDKALQGRCDQEDVVECLAVPRADGDRQRDLLFMVCGLAQGDAMAESLMAATRRNKAANAVHQHDAARVPNADEPVVMVLMADPSHRPAVSSLALESLFGLTPTEAQIANAFADGLRTEEIARQFRISSTTVNFHKRNLFEKTGTNRQADLIALLLSLPSYTES